jgi:hypothetical protein
MVDAVLAAGRDGRLHLQALGASARRLADTGARR